MSNAAPDFKGRPIPAPDVRRSVEERGLRLVDPGRNRSLRMYEPAAALWDYITAGVTCTDAAARIALITKHRKQAVARWQRICLQTWTAQDWLRWE